MKFKSQLFNSRKFFMKHKKKIKTEYMITTQYIKILLKIVLNFT
jgi:hypothetical protein